ncbi:MAG TPA: DinB family protein, partial [Gemmatimonadaceae bacterium]|nr:DinB family protein [Gemmatimonadaceae bacterium]
MRLLGSVAASALLALSAPALPAQTTTPAAASDVRKELMGQLEDAERKLVALAEATPQDKYGWRPAAGVRSVGEVFGHVAGESFVLPTAVGVAAPSDWQAADMQGMFAKVEALEKIGDENRTRAELTRSFGHFRLALESTPDDTGRRRLRQRALRRPLPRA